MTASQAPALKDITNHIFLVLDASESMTSHAAMLVRVADTEIRNMAALSQEHGQETRVTVYTFSSAGTARCVIWDKDVLRMPSIANLYKPGGMTALVEATTLAITDLMKTPQMYGDHAFLAYVLTDGMENQHGSPQALSSLIGSLQDNWTLAVFVPTAKHAFYAKQFGFPAGNISVWDTTAEHGTEDVGRSIYAATSNYMTSRSQGVRSTRSLFQVSASASDVTRSLTPLTRGSYYILDVAIEDGMNGTVSKTAKDAPAIRIDDYMLFKTGRPYEPGKCFYQFTKPETIQADKMIAVKTGDDVYTGAAARALLKLPNHEIRVKPGDHKDCTIFVQSKAFNRLVLAGTKLLVLR